MSKSDPREVVARQLLKKIKAGQSVHESAKELSKILPEDFPKFEGARAFLRRRLNTVDPEDDSEEIENSTSFDENLGKGTGQFEFRGKLDRQMTVDELLEDSGVNTDIYEISRIKVNSWGVTAKMGSVETGDQRLEAAKNYQITIWLAKISINTSPEKLLESAADKILKSVERVATESKKRYAKTKTHPCFQSGTSDPDRMLEVSIFDLHMGKLCWNDETAQGDWDSKIAASAAMEALDDLLTFFPNYTKIWLPLGHDFFNSDGPGENGSGGRTTRGTGQDEDTRWAKSIDSGVDLALAMVERCKEFAPVDITVMPGNHDEQRSKFMGRLLKETYRHDPHVDVDDGNTLLKKYDWGEVFLATCHGQLESQQKVVTECAIMFPEFGKANWREIHTGHGHRMKSAGMFLDGTEEQSVRWRMIPSLTSPDSYHARNLYHNHPAAECYLWHKTEHYNGHHSFNRARVVL